MAFFSEIEKVVMDGETLSLERRKLLLTKDRHRDLVLPKQLVMYFLKLFNGNNMSWAKIGAVYNKDHATAIHAIKAINNLIDTDKLFAGKVIAYRGQIEEIINFEKNIGIDHLEAVKEQIKNLVNNDITIPSQMLTSYNWLVERKASFKNIANLKLPIKAAS